MLKLDQELENFPTLTWVVAVALAGEGGQILLQKRPLDKDHGGLWEFPGGKVERGETPAFAAVRELAEELGIAVEPENLTPVSFAEDTPGLRSRPIVILLYTCRVWEGEPAACDGAEVGWFALAEAGTLAMPPLDAPLLCALNRMTGSD